MLNEAERLQRERDLTDCAEKMAAALELKARSNA